MYVGLLSLVRSLLTFPSEQHREVDKGSSFDDHTYIQGNIANRGPCPGLNALVNHGHLYVAAISSSQPAVTDTKKTS
jgi:hypothetical protein